MRSNRLINPRADLIALGRALYGDRWQTAVSRFLGVGDRTVRRWVAGTRGVPADAIDRLREALIEDRVEQALAAIDDLTAAAGQPAAIRLAAQTDPDAQAVTDRVASALRARGVAVDIVPVDPAAHLSFVGPF